VDNQKKYQTCGEAPLPHLGPTSIFSGNVKSWMHPPHDSSNLLHNSLEHVRFHVTSSVMDGKWWCDPIIRYCISTIALSLHEIFGSGSGHQSSIVPNSSSLGILYLVFSLNLRVVLEYIILVYSRQVQNTTLHLPDTSTSTVFTRSPTIFKSPTVTITSMSFTVLLRINSSCKCLQTY
jgi:hypothetical protein